jgi:bacteriocin-like protein
MNEQHAELNMPVRELTADELDQIVGGRQGVASKPTMLNTSANEYIWAYNVPSYYNYYGYGDRYA